MRLYVGYIAKVAVKTYSSTRPPEEGSTLKANPSELHSGSAEFLI